MDEAQQLLLWRWSTLVQVSSVAMAAAFFALLARSNRRAELRWWARAWGFNLIAIVVTLLFWMFQLAGLVPFVAIAYLGGKLAFTLLLIQGAWAMIRPGGRLFRTGPLSFGVALYAVAGSMLLKSVESVGIAQHSVIGAILIGFSILLLRSRAEGVTWLIAGFALRGLLALAEAGAYVIQALQPATGIFAGWVTSAGSFVSASSSFDTGSEWLIVLGCVLAVSERGRRQLENANRNLILAQEDLRRLADRDPLTGAINRRALRDIFNELETSQAMLLFFDLDGFKAINDLHGHAAGDTCLKLFAAALKDSFRSNDHVVRYGGDEFLVIAPGLDHAAARVRVEDVTQRLADGRAQGVSCGFSVGMAELSPGVQPEAVLQLADENMYKAKNQERR